MAFAIHFDGQLTRQTSEIDYIRADRVLPTKLETAGGAVAENSPQPDFGGNGVLAQGASTLDGCFVSGHCESPRFRISGAPLTPALSPRPLTSCTCDFVGGRGETEQR